MQKEHQLEHKHKRFYVFSHLNGADIQYRTSTGSWDPEFTKAMLWDSEKFATKKAVEFKTDHAWWAAPSKIFPNGAHPDADRKFVVGSVNVEVDGFYIGSVV